MSAGPKYDEEVMLKLVIIFLMILLTVSGVSPACGRAEYLIGQECCPMCGPGHYVRRHCTEFTSTTCVPCMSSTYTDAPNDWDSCKPCTVCDSSAGLRVKRAYSSTSDTLCEPLEGHYCTDPIKDGCRGAVEHTKCSPGQYVNQTGTASTDTVCGDCVGDTYSNGSFTSCRPHTQCELIGLVVLREGSSSNDTDCGQRQNTVAIVAGIIAGVAVLAATCWAVFIYIRRKRTTKAKQVETCLENGTQQKSGRTVTEEKSELCVRMAAITQNVLNGSHDHSNNGDDTCVESDTQEGSDPAVTTEEQRPLCERKAIILNGLNSSYDRINNGAYGTD